MKKKTLIPIIMFVIIITTLNINTINYENEVFKVQNAKANIAWVDPGLCGGSCVDCYGGTVRIVCSYGGDGCYVEDHCTGGYC